jgi:hypothetical protein
MNISMFISTGGLATRQTRRICQIFGLGSDQRLSPPETLDSVVMFIIQ